MLTSQPNDDRRRPRTTDADANGDSDNKNKSTEAASEAPSSFFVPGSANLVANPDAAPAVSTTRKGSAFPMRHPVDVRLHSNDFKFEDYAAECKQRQEQAKHEQEEKQKQVKREDDKQQQQEKTTNAAESAKKKEDEAKDGDNENGQSHFARSKAARSAAFKNAQKERQDQQGAELRGEAAEEFVARQAAAWERHYQNTQNHFFPIKNYLAQAFSSVIFPLFPTRIPQQSENDDAGEKNEGKTNNSNNNNNNNNNDDDDNNNNHNTAAGADDDDDQQTSPPALINGAIDKDAPPPVAKFIVECGCGTGSALLPIIQTAGQFHTFAGFDISATAVELFRKHAILQQMPEGVPKPTLFVHDMSAADIPAEHVAPGSADIVLLIFVLSAIEKSKFRDCVRRLRDITKPGTGKVCFRDYGILDNSYFRFQKNGNKQCRGSYVKGDDTQSYFFELGEVRDLFGEFFDVDQLEYHCNRVSNRKTGVQMHKVIVNGIFTRKR